MADRAVAMCGQLSSVSYDRQGLLMSPHMAMSHDMSTDMTSCHGRVNWTGGYRNDMPEHYYSWLNNKNKYR